MFDDLLLTYFAMESMEGTEGLERSMLIRIYEHCLKICCMFARGICQNIYFTTIHEI